MTPRDDFDRLLSTWFEADAPAREPEHLLGRILAQTNRVRRRPGWLLRDRWLSPQATTRFAVASRTVTWAALLALVAAAIIAGLVLVGSQHRPPPPFGIARPGLIAFDSDGRIFVANADGTGRRQLTSGPLDIGPTWSLDGTKLAYWARSGQGEPASLVVMDADGHHSVTVTSGVTLQGHDSLVGNLIGDIAWSPDSRRLLFSSFFNGSWTLFLASADRYGATPIGDPTLRGTHPAWSPDGKTIAFGGGAYDLDRGVYLMNEDGSGARRLTTVSGVGGKVFTPVWSPDGQRIAFTAGGGYTASISVIGADGTHERAIAADPSWDENLPSWSPDGMRIAFERSAAGCGCPAQVMIVDADGSHSIALAERKIAYGSQPIWSPDGTKVFAYVLAPNDPLPGGVVVLPVDGSASVIIPAPGIQGVGNWQRLGP
jgi:Tol biopolymer transport system component